MRIADKLLETLIGPASPCSLPISHSRLPFGLYERVVCRIRKGMPGVRTLVTEAVYSTERSRQLLRPGRKLATLAYVTCCTGGGSRGRSARFRRYR